jgi:hypothetical protein
MFHALKMLAHHEKPGIRQHAVNIRHAAGQGILAWQHGQIALPITQRRHGGFKGRARQGLRPRIGSAAGKIGIGAKDALEGDANL